MFFRNLSKRHIVIAILLLVTCAGLFLVQNKTSKPRLLSRYSGPGSHWELDFFSNQSFQLRRFTQLGGQLTHSLDGTFTRLSKDYIDFSVLSTTGAGLAFGNGDHFYGIELHGFSIAMEDPFLPNKDLLYVVQRPACPQPTIPADPDPVNYEITLNWGAEQYFGNKFVDENINPNAGADVVGSANYTRATSILDVLNLYTTSGLQVGANVSLPQIACDGNTITGGDVRMYLGRYMAGVVRVDPANQVQDKTLVLLPRTSFSLSQLEGIYSGFLRDTGSGLGNLYPVKVVFNDQGLATVNEFTQLNPITVGAQTHTIQLTQSNYNSRKGMFVGTITGANTKPIICNGSYRFGGGPRHLIHCVTGSTSINGKTNKLQTLILQRSENYRDDYTGLPLIESFNQNPIQSLPGQERFFINDQDLVDHVTRTQPFMGIETLAQTGCAGHSGAHLHFSRPQVANGSYFVDIITPVSGTVTNISNCTALGNDPLNSMKKYDMRIQFAKTETLAPMTLNLSLEPMIEAHRTVECTGVNGINGGNGYAAHFRVVQGASVTAGDVVAVLEVPPIDINGGDNTHLHVDITESSFPESDNVALMRRQPFVATNLFDQAIADKFDGTLSASGYPVSDFPNACNIDTSGFGFEKITNGAENLMPSND